eukprot:4181869-Ditylum_brightwellii.AAC.1
MRSTIARPPPEPPPPQATNPRPPQSTSTPQTTTTLQSKPDAKLPGKIKVYNPRKQMSPAGNE